MRIDTDVPEIIVEIEDKEYPVAVRNVQTMEKLAEVERACVGKPNYKLWLAELEVLLGKPACRELFTSGKLENVDRVQKIYAGVAAAFQNTDDVLAEQKREKAAESIATALAPLNELLRHLRALDSDKNDKTGSTVREIHRG